MHTIVLYSTKYGGTKVCAEHIAALMPGKTTLHCLDENPEADLSPYDCVALGCSIYISKPRKAVRQFARMHEKELLEKPLGLFMCCIQDIEKNVTDQFDLTYPRALQEHALAMESFGGLVNFTKLKTMDRIFMNMIAGDLRKKTGGDIISTIDEGRIRSFCKRLVGEEAP